MTRIKHENESSGSPNREERANDFIRERKSLDHCNKTKRLLAVTIGWQNKTMSAPKLCSSVVLLEVVKTSYKIIIRAARKKNCHEERERAEEEEEEEDG